MAPRRDSTAVIGAGGIDGYVSAAFGDWGGKVGQGGQRRVGARAYVPIMDRVRGLFNRPLHDQAPRTYLHHCYRCPCSFF